MSVQLKRVTILIPCYNQPHLLERCLKSILQQINFVHAIIIVDDCSSVCYSSLLKQFNHLPIHYIQHESNMGAVHNMFYCIRYPVLTEYKVVFHEDDIMYPRMLQEQIRAFKKYPEAGWVGGNMSFFEKNFYFEKWNEKKCFFVQNNIHVLIELILHGNTLSFGSVMYRSAICQDLKFDFEKYSVVGDRPMLIETAKKHGCVFLGYSLVAAQSHGSDVSRWTSLRLEHVLNYCRFLKTHLTNNQSKEFQYAFTHLVVNLFALLSKKNKKNGKLSFFHDVISEGFFSFKYYFLTYKWVLRASKFLRSNESRIHNI